MAQATIHRDVHDDETARWIACSDCGQLEHPEFTCAQAADLIRAAALRELFRIHGLTVLAALEDAAADRVERADGYCLDCVDAEEGRCETHQGDLDRAAEYRRTFDALHTAL